MGEFEKLAYEAALRGLDKQEGQLGEMRARTGLLLAASSLGTSFLGQQAFRHSHPRALAVSALLAFVVSVVTSVFILMPREDLAFSEAGRDLYESLYAVRGDMAEIYRRLVYDLDRRWHSNNGTIGNLIRAYKTVAAAVVIEVVSLVILLGASIFGHGS